MFTWSPDTGRFFQAYNGPLQSGPPPQPPQRPPGTIANRVFHRLKWSVLDSPSKVEVFVLDPEDNPQWTTYLTDRVADEAATAPPQPRLQIKMQPLCSWERWRQAEKESLKPLLIAKPEWPASLSQAVLTSGSRLRRTSA